MADVAQLTEETGGKDGDGEEDEASTTSAPPRTIWSGSLRIGLINIPVKAFSMTRNTRISFRMLHRTCQTPISFKRYCQEGEEVSLADIVYGYPLGRDKYVILGKEEIDRRSPNPGGPSPWTASSTSLRSTHIILRRPICSCPTALRRPTLY